MRRDVLKVHPAADAFPLMSEDELKSNGLRNPIVLWGSAPALLIDGAKPARRDGACRPADIR